MRLTRSGGLAGLLPAYEPLPLTYPEVGRTLGDLPAGYRHVRRRARVGQGDAAFERAAAGLMAWQVHERSGLRVAARGPVSPGRTVVLGLGPELGGAGPRLVVPCRVVAVVEEAGRRGFAYGTLPGHSETGEESFLVERDGGGVWFAITAFSRPGDRLTGLVPALGHAAQDLWLRRYRRAAVGLAGVSS